MNNDYESIQMFRGIVNFGIYAAFGALLVLFLYFKFRKKGKNSEESGKKADQPPPPKTPE
ncbi:MAG: hypothetical protein ABI579_07695 [Candidatus Sumerlaeota bacterium]